MILVLSDLWLPFPGGAERLIFNLARDLMRRGEEVRVITGYHDAQQFDGPPVLSLAVPETELGARALHDVIEGLAPDVILTHHYWAQTFEDAICAPGIPVVQIVLNGRRMKCAALAVYISEYVRSQPDKTPQPQDVTILPLAFADVVAPSHGDAIGFIKPLPHKGVDLVYKIARAMPDREFLILRGEWQDLETIRDLPNVEYMEPVADIRDFYKRVRMMLVPSLSEDAGTIGQECALNRIPCLSSDAGGLPETNQGGVIIFDRKVARWCSVIEQLDKPDLYEQIVQGQREETPTSQTELLDDFAARVHLLAR